MTTRREAIVRLSALLAGARISRASLTLDAPEDRRHPLHAIGLQLYTVRELLKKDFEGTLAAIAHIGFREVELAGPYTVSARAMRAMLDRVGLRAVGSHESIERLRGDRQRVLDDAATLGQQWVVCSWINDEDRSREGLKRVMHDFAVAAQAAKSRGMRFAYHNHEYDFRPLPDGARLYDVLLDDPAGRDVKMELDIYWTVTGGADPLRYFARYPGRFPLLHLKDRTKNGKMVNVGQGVIDWRAILAHRKQAGVQHVFIEHDEPPDALADAAASFRYVQQMP